MHAVSVEPPISIRCICQAERHNGSGVSDSLVPERPLFGRLVLLILIARGLTRLLVRFLTHIESLFLELRSSGSSLCGVAKGKERA